MEHTRHRRKQRRVIAAVMLLAILISVFSPVTANATFYRAKVVRAGKTYYYRFEDTRVGIDISKWNGTVNWKKVAATDVEFAFIRASIGTENDPNFVTNAKGAYENGIHVGAYHYARFKTSAEVKKEASTFLKQLGRATLTYPVVLDIENHYKLSKSKLTALALEFCSILEQNGYTAMIYTYQNFFTGHLNVSKLGDYDLWVANYTSYPKGIEHVAWQHTSTGKVSGVSGNVDINVAYKDLSVKKVPAKSSGTSNTSGASNTSASGGKATATTHTSIPTSGDENEAPVDSGQVIHVGDRPPEPGDTGTQMVITNFMNEHYSSQLGTVDDTSATIPYAFQIEVNKQLGGDVKLTGRLTDTELDLLSDVTFTLGKTKGRITTLVQSSLHMKGYQDEITGVYDDAMAESIKAFQRDAGLEPTGQLTRDTWKLILDL